jgi:1,4-dihydroxy-2-naphthoate octaprenyltransferase
MTPSMRFWLEIILVNIGTQGFGALVFWGVSVLVGLVYRPAAKWVFIGLMAIWLVMGVLYTISRATSPGRERV